METEEQKLNKQNAGGLMSVITGKTYRDKANKKKKQDRKNQPAITRAKHSETKLISTYEDLAKASKRYYTSFEKHLKNLITLDDINGMTPGLVSTFRNIVVKNELKGKDKIDVTNPLLLRNYLVSSETLPRNFRKEHLLQQVRYKLSQINPKDALLFNALDVKLEGKTATIIYHVINGDTYERTNKVNDEYMLDMSKLLSDIRDVVGSVKKKMDYEIEIVEDFELGEDEVEIPGLQFLNTDEGMEAKLRAVEMGKSISPDNADVETLSEAEKKADEREPPPRDIVFDMSSEAPAYKPPPSADVIGDNPEDIGLDQGFGTYRQLEKKPLDIEADLSALIKGGPEAAGAGPGAFGAPMGANTRGQSRRRSTMKARERRFGSESSSRRSRKSRRANNEDLDPMESRCRAISDEKECKQTIGCHYNKGYQKCHKDVKI